MSERRARRVLLSAMLSCATAAAAADDPPAWTRPAAPFHIVGPIWHVGSEGLAAYLIRTRAGLILIDGTLDGNVPGIERNIERLGFKLSDVKLLLNSHAHFDHAAGLARLKRDSGARLLASPADAPALESGVPPSQVSYGVVRFPAVKVDGRLRDGQRVRLGEVALTPIFTPGHTPGCTSWTMRVAERGRTLRVMFPCSLSVAGNKLVGNRGYPGIVGDYRASFARLARVEADVVLPGHGELVDLQGRARRAAAGERGAFLMPGVLRKMVDDARVSFERELAKAN